MAKKQCGIIRISDARSGGKIKSKTQLKSRLMHNLRGDKLSGDKRLWHINHEDGFIEVLYGPDSVEGVMDDAQKLYDRLDIQPTVDKGKMRDSVHAVELLLAYSPDIANQIQQADWEDDALAWLKRSFKERIISVVCHKDETTPHIHAIMIPIMKRLDGKFALRANQFFDNEREKQKNGTYKVTKNRMEIMQDSYHEHVSSKHGLKRGEKVSEKLADAPVVTHKHVRKWRQEQAVENFLLRIRTPTELTAARDEIAGMKRNLRREMRKARREGSDEKAKELETTLNSFKQQVKILTSQSDNLFESNVSLQNDLDEVNQQVEQLKDGNEKLLCKQVDLVNQIRVLTEKIRGNNISTAAYTAP